MQADQDVAELAEMAGYVFSTLIELRFDDETPAIVVVSQNEQGVRGRQFGSLADAQAHIQQNEDGAKFAVVGAATTDGDQDKFMATCIRHGEPRLMFSIALPYRFGDSQAEHSIGPGIELVRGLDEGRFAQIGRKLALGVHGCPRGAELWQIYQVRPS